MRFATYEHDGRVASGVVRDGWIYPLDGGLRLDDLPAQGSAADVRGPRVGEVRLLPPIQPSTIRDFVAFEEHVEGVRRSIDQAFGVPEAWYDAPTFYFTNPYAVIGAFDEVPMPPGAHVLDFELEVAAVIGRAGRDLTPGQAREHIVGYTIFNDWSARDLQSREMQVGLGPCKGKDTAATLGPYLVTADELEPYRDDEGFLRLALTAEINSETVGRDLLSNMSWTFEETAAYASRGTDIRPGDVLGSGTCGNGGCLAELWGVRGKQIPPPLKPGDVVTLTVEGIGRTENVIVPGREPIPLPLARRRPRTRP